MMRARARWDDANAWTDRITINRYRRTRAAARAARARWRTAGQAMQGLKEKQCKKEKQPMPWQPRAAAATVEEEAFCCISAGFESHGGTGPATPL
eukprot:SAG31_NODE_17555_length_666_cov_1.451499_1_plen_95_part_00